MTSFQIPSTDPTHEEEFAFLSSPEYVVVFEIPGPTSNTPPIGWLWCTVEPGRPGFTKKIATKRDGITPLDEAISDAAPITGRMLFQY